MSRKREIRREKQRKVITNLRRRLKKARKQQPNKRRKPFVMKGGFAESRYTAPAAKGMIKRKKTDNKIIVHKREVLLSPIVSTIGPGEETLHLALNPGDSATFPWLSAIANNYEQYQWRSVVIRWVTALPTSASGLVTISPDYDVMDQSVYEEEDMMQNADAVQGTIWKSFSVPLNSMDKKWLYVSGSPYGPAATVDPKTYTNIALNIVVDHGRVEGTTLGNLYMDYTVAFRKEQTNNGIGSSQSVFVSNQEITPSGLFNNSSFDTIINSAGVKVGYTKEGTLSNDHMTIQQPGIYEYTYTASGALNNRPTTTPWSVTDGEVLSWQGAEDQVNTGTWIVKAIIAVANTILPSEITKLAGSLLDNADAVIEVVELGMSFLYHNTYGAEYDPLAEGRIGLSLLTPRQIKSPGWKFHLARARVRHSRRTLAYKTHPIRVMQPVSQVPEPPQLNCEETDIETETDTETENESDPEIARMTLQKEVRTQIDAVKRKKARITADPSLIPVLGSLDKLRGEEATLKEYMSKLNGC